MTHIIKRNDLTKENGWREDIAHDQNGEPYECKKRTLPDGTVEIVDNALWNAGYFR